LGKEHKQGKVVTSEFLPKSLAAFNGTALISNVFKKELPEWFMEKLLLLAGKI
jgi:hypothetical protein